jgi:hypothetical protein
VKYNYFNIKSEHNNAPVPFLHEFKTSVALDVTLLLAFPTENCNSEDESLTVTRRFAKINSSTRAALTSVLDVLGRQLQSSS